MAVHKKVAILQSNYVPWKGYFDLINLVDEFVLLDDVQYTKGDWRNRNRIKTPHGLRWLTIPVLVKDLQHQAIKDTLISDERWSRRHWLTLSQSYARSEFFHLYRDLFQDLYLGCEERSLSRINHRFLVAICDILGIRTKISWSMDYRLTDGKTDRLIDLCRQLGATEYVSGPAARAYIDDTRFGEANILLRYVDYSGYPEYPQLYPPFEHGVSILDLLFSCGPRSRDYLKSF
jgi:hypothetical protein